MSREAHNWGESQAADAVFRSVCGLAPRLLAERLFMPLTAFVDESYDDRLFVMAGYISDVAKWAEFSAAWERLLPFASLNRRGTYQFKMRDMAKSESRMESVPLFYRQIEKFAEVAISVQFDIGVINRALSRISCPGFTINWAGWRDPYLVAFRALTDTLNLRRSEFGFLLSPETKIDFVFDKHGHENRVKGAWNKIKADLKPEQGALYGTARFEDDEEFLPLQAADFWAWWIRRWGVVPNEKQAPLGEFPWPSNQNKPPKIMIYFDEDGFLEFVLDIARHGAPEREFIVAPKD